MIAVVQRVLRARVVVGERVVGEVGRGMAVLAAVEADDTDFDITWTAGKLAGLRMFAAEGKNFELDVVQAGGGMLLVSNFTVAAATRQGRRSSLSNAAPPEKGREMFDKLVAAVRALGVPVSTGEFGADMLVEIANDGPVTFLVSSREARPG